MEGVSRVDDKRRVWGNETKVEPGMIRSDQRQIRHSKVVSVNSMETMCEKSYARIRCSRGTNGSEYDKVSPFSRSNSIISTLQRSVVSSY